MKGKTHEICLFQGIETRPEIHIFAMLYKGPPTQEVQKMN
jgi:hypothetical protein